LGSAQEGSCAQVPTDPATSQARQTPAQPVLQHTPLDDRREEAARVPLAEPGRPLARPIVLPRIDERLHEQPFPLLRQRAVRELPAVPLERRERPGGLAADQRDARNLQQTALRRQPIIALAVVGARGVRAGGPREPRRRHG
jgi:hypothetical protein